MNYWDYPSSQTNLLKQNLCAIFGWKFKDVHAYRQGKFMVIEYQHGIYKLPHTVELFYTEILKGKRHANI